MNFTHSKAINEDKQLCMLTDSNQSLYCSFCLDDMELLNSKEIVIDIYALS